VGRDVRSFDAGIYAALRSDPDVIAIGELRDARAIAAALRAAETGHLVLATVHSDSAVGAVERIIDAFGHDGNAVRPQLAAVIEAILAVALLPRRGGGRIFGTELLLGTDAVRALIREGKTHQLENSLATGRSVGMHTMESRIAELVARGEVAV
jgi:twitching motility protein PilT